jgi:hypothetical protein
MRHDGSCLREFRAVEAGGQQAIIIVLSDFLGSDPPQVEEKDVDRCSPDVVDREFQLHQVVIAGGKEMFLTFVIYDHPQSFEIYSWVGQETHAADLPPVRTVWEDELQALDPADPTEQPAALVAFDFIGGANDQAGLIRSVRNWPG